MAVGRGRRGHAPRAALCRRWHLEGRIYGIMKLGRVDVSHSLTHLNTPPALGPRPLTVNASRPYTKQCVHHETYTADLTEHSPAVEL